VISGLAHLTFGSCTLLPACSRPPAHGPCRTRGSAACGASQGPPHAHAVWGLSTQLRACKAGAVVPGWANCVAELQRISYSVRHLGFLQISQRYPFGGGKWPLLQGVFDSLGRECAAKQLKKNLWRVQQTKPASVDKYRNTCSV